MASDSEPSSLLKIAVFDNLTLFDAPSPWNTANIRMYLTLPVSRVPGLHVGHLVGPYGRGWL